MGTLILLAWRNLWRNVRRTLITSSTIAIGYALAMWNFGINDGSHQQMIANAIRMGEGHLTIQPREYLAAPANHLFLSDGRGLLNELSRVDIPGVVVPRISLQVLASTAANSLGVNLIAIDPRSDPQNSGLQGALVEGKLLEPADDRGLLIGAKMADKLGARVGSKIVVMAGKSGGDIEAHLGRVTGVFRSKVDELDSFVIYASLPFGRRFLVAEGADAAAEPVTRVDIFLDGGEQVQAMKARLAGLALPAGAALLDWQEMMPEIVSFVAVDDVGAFVTVGILMILVAFGILNTILMSVLERTREFGLLRALGMGRGRLLALVILETVILALCSLVVGSVLGWGQHAYFAVYGLDLTSLYGEGLQSTQFYLEPVIYSSLNPGRVETLTAIVFAVTFLSGIYPALRAARVAPIRALQT
jgi:ABC-type lipoprotein release transport system permease subunit